MIHNEIGSKEEALSHWLSVKPFITSHEVTDGDGWLRPLADHIRWIASICVRGANVCFYLEFKRPEDFQRLRRHALRPDQDPPHFGISDIWLPVDHVKRIMIPISGSGNVEACVLLDLSYNFPFPARREVGHAEIFWGIVHMRIRRQHHSLTNEYIGSVTDGPF